RAIDDDFPQLRLFSQYFGQLLCLARWPMQGDQLTHDGCQLPNPFTDLALGNAKEQAHHILGRIGLVVEKDEKQFLLGTDQTALSSATRLTSTRSARGSLARSYRRPHDVETPG